MGANLEPKAVGDINGSFFVPAYQRGYRWRAEEVDQLLDDIWESNGDRYYLQPIVVKDMGDEQWELIDGQQRLTTLYLIFTYMFAEGLQSMGAPYTIDYDTRPGSGEFLREPSEAKRSDNVDFHHIYGGYERIRDWFESHEHRKQVVANRFYEYLFNSVKVIWYQVANTPEFDSISLFTRLNVGRIALTDAELVKALLLSQVRQLPGVSDKSAQIAAQWDVIERDLRDPEVWAFITGGQEEAATHIELILDTLADRKSPPPKQMSRPVHHTFETLRPVIGEDPREFWDEVVGLHALITGWYEDRDLFHKVGYLVATGTPFSELLDSALNSRRSAFEESLDERIRSRLKLTPDDLGSLTYEENGQKCELVLLLMNVETIRTRADSTERYSFRAYASGRWSLEHIHAQNAQGMRRDEKVWAAWLRLHRTVLLEVPDLPVSLRDKLLAKVDELLAVMDQPRRGGVGSRFNALRAEVEAALSESSAGEEDLHSISNLALLASEDNSALNNSTFAVKRMDLLERDKAGSYIPVCTRNVFLKYYTDFEFQQPHFWGRADREGYMASMRSVLSPYLLPDEEIS